MVEKLVSDVVVERLTAWGVERVFEYSGDGINGVVEALNRTGNRPAFIQARHEENAAFMAVGHAKFTGQVGVVMSTQGPGAIHLLNGLYDAKLDGAPVVAIVGQQARSVLGAGYMQEVNLSTLFGDVASRFTQLVSSPEQIPFVIDKAFRTALVTRSPVVVIIPHDIQNANAAPPTQEHGRINTNPRYWTAHVLPQEEDIRAAAELLSAGTKVAFLVGQGAKEAWPAVQALAEKLGAGITTSLLGKPARTTRGRSSIPPLARRPRFSWTSTRSSSATDIPLTLGWPVTPAPLWKRCSPSWSHQQTRPGWQTSAVRCNAGAT